MSRFDHKLADIQMHGRANLAGTKAEPLGDRSTARSAVAAVVIEGAREVRKQAFVQPGYTDAYNDQAAKSISEPHPSSTSIILSSLFVPETPNQHAT